tara:strand:+ start:1191 stop:1607 length:417 start_codon:yes stop_codon:yes gene_type:complete
MYLEIVNKGEIKTSEKINKNYRTVSVRENQMSQFTKPDGTQGIAKGVAKTGTIVVWENRWDDGFNDLGYDETVGSYLMGSVVRRKVLPYALPDGQVVNSYKTVVLGDTTDPSFELNIDRAFKRANHEIMEETAMSVMS